MFLFILNFNFFSAESFKSFWQTSWHFTHQNFNTSKNKDILLHNQSAIIAWKVNANTILRKNIQRVFKFLRLSQEWPFLLDQCSFNERTFLHFFFCIFLCTQINVPLSTNSFDEKKEIHIPLEIEKREIRIFKKDSL